ncbi:MAG: MoaD/ThiS family protein [Dehalococcoidia bacterium]
MTDTPTIQVRVTAVLQNLTGGQKRVSASGATVAAILEDLDRSYPGFKGKVYGEDGKLHRFVNVYLNDEDIRYMGGAEAAVKAGDVLDILPALAGGARSPAVSHADRRLQRHGVRR